MQELCRYCGKEKKGLYDGYGTSFACIDPECIRREGKEFLDFIHETTDRTALKPQHLGGLGLGVLCPTCHGNGYVKKDESPS